MGIIKKYEDGIVLPIIRFTQMRVELVQLHDLILRKMIGFVRWEGKYWALCKGEEGTEHAEYYRVPIAHNTHWFIAIRNEPAYVSLRSLPQVYLI